jgi:hypothetical protein
MANESADGNTHDLTPDAKTTLKDLNRFQTKTVPPGMMGAMMSVDLRAVDEGAVAERPDVQGRGTEPSRPAREEIATEEDTATDTEVPDEPASDADAPQAPPRSRRLLIGFVIVLTAVAATLVISFLIGDGGEGADRLGARESADQGATQPPAPKPVTPPAATPATVAAPPETAAPQPSARAPSAPNPARTIATAAPTAPASRVPNPAASGKQPQGFVPPHEPEF